MNIPDELIIHITSFLLIQDIIQLSMVNKNMHNIIRTYREYIGKWRQCKMRMYSGKELIIPRCIKTELIHPRAHGSKMIKELDVHKVHKDIQLSVIFPNLRILYVSKLQAPISDCMRLRMLTLNFASRGYINWLPKELNTLTIIDSSIDTWEEFRNMLTEDIDEIEDIGYIECKHLIIEKMYFNYADISHIKCKRLTVNYYDDALCVIGDVVNNYAEEVHINHDELSMTAYNAKKVHIENITDAGCTFSSLHSLELFNIREMTINADYIEYLYANKARIELNAKTGKIVNVNSNIHQTP